MASDDKEAIINSDYLEESMNTSENSERFNDEEIPLDDFLYARDKKIDATTQCEPTDQNEVLNLVKGDIDNFLQNSGENKNVALNIKKAADSTSKFSLNFKNVFGKKTDNKSTGEVIRDKILQADFDKKMKRVNKIKSRVFRKFRREKNKLIEKEKLMETVDYSSSEENELSEIDDEGRLDENNKTDSEMKISPLISFQNKNESSQKAVREMFDESDSSNSDEDTFEEEKKQIIEEEKPKIIKTVFEGWGSWAGDGINSNTIVENKNNTKVEFKDGIKVEDRKDYKLSNVIINEKTKYNEDYQGKIIKGKDMTVGKYYKMNKRSIRQQKPVGLEVKVRKHHQE